MLRSKKTKPDVENGRSYVADPAADADASKKNRNNNNTNGNFVLFLIIVFLLLELRWNLPREHRGSGGGGGGGAVKAKAAEREWPPGGGVEWPTGEEAVERARNKAPPGVNETTSNHPHPFLKNGMKFRESALFHKYLDGLKGIECGSSAHNGFGLDTLNVDFSGGMTTFKKSEVDNTGVYRRVDIVSAGNQLPFGASSLDFIVSSHMMEHLNDPIGFVCEAARVVRPGGYIAAILPNRTAHKKDASRPRTTLAELIQRHTHPIDPAEDDHRHWQVWMVEDMIEMYEYMNMKVVASLAKDDKVGNGFSTIAEVPQDKFRINC